MHTLFKMLVILQVNIFLFKLLYRKHYGAIQ